MEGLEELIQKLGKTDIYLIDQIMKNRYSKGDRILDAGCGNGRNIHLLKQLGMDLYGQDISINSISSCKNSFPAIEGHFKVGGLSKIDYPDTFFNHIICSAVLHFSQSKDHFLRMIQELDRVLKKEGTLFIRMHSVFGLTDQLGLSPKKLHKRSDGLYDLQEEKGLFLIDRLLIEEIEKLTSLKIAQAIKSVNVDDKRAMSVLLFQKKS